MTHHVPDGSMSVRKIADTLLRDLSPVDPIAAQALGDESADPMPALSPDAFDTRRAAQQRALDSLTGIEPLAGDVVLAAALTERLGSDIALDDSGFTRSLLAPLATPVHQVREVFDNLPRQTRPQWDLVAACLSRVPQALADYTETLRVAAAAGHRVAARQVSGAAAQCTQWVSPSGDDFYHRLVGGAPDLPGLSAGADAATKATMRFAQFLRTELLPAAPQQDAVGPERYAVTASAFLGDVIDLPETYEFGWEELSRLTAEMTDVARDMGHSSIREAAAALDAEPGQQLTGPEQLVGWLQSRVDEVTDAVDGTHFDLPTAGRRAECRLSDAASGVMYYSQPDAAFTRPGRIWWSPRAGGAPSFAWREATTVHHEGVPGHHLQIVVAMAEPHLHPWQRSMAHVHGYVEGWTHYAERLCDELGLVRTPGERLGMLYGQRWRAARIVIDMGLHLGLPIPAGNGFTEEKIWTPELGAQVLQTASGCDEASARFEVDRYLGWPAQALAFRVGARLWRQVRETAERRTGFDLRSFHMHALRLGPLGLGPLRRILIGDQS
jgi:uncharacterized protein (DUF885 family)